LKNENAARSNTNITRGLCNRGPGLLDQKVSKKKLNP
jgi:hypothetical protein